MKKLLNLILAFTASFAVYAQTLSPTYDVGRQKAETLISKNVELCQDGEELYTIPVVFHVLHTGEPVDFTTRQNEVIWRSTNKINPSITRNVSREQIYSAIRNLNDRFNNTWFPYWLNEEDAVPTSVDAGIQFVLANTDPSGNPTSGIIRHDLSSDSNYSENGFITETFEDTDRPDIIPNELSIKSSTGWDREKYLNIWVATEINANDGGCGIMAYSYLPSTDLTELDGIVIQYNRLGYGNFNAVNGDINTRLTEAVGTYLGLYQTWYDTPSCEAANNESDCQTQGDRCCDTPPTPRNCSAYGSSRCTSPNGEPSQQFYSTVINVYPDTYNYMDDTGPYAKRRFSQDQVCRMRSTLQTVRTNLANQAWITSQVAVHNLGVDVSVERTGHYTFKPVAIIENSGTFEEDSYTVSVQVTNSTETFNYSYDQNDLGSISPGQVFNVRFPEIQIKDIGEWTITASISEVGEYAEDNQKDYIFNKYNDGSISFNANYRRAFWTIGGSLGQADIYNMDTEEIVLDGRKFYSNSFLGNKKIASENYKFVGYGTDPYGNPAGNVTVYNATGIDEAWEVRDTWYLPPGNYILRFHNGYTVTDGPGVDQVTHLLYNSCQDGCNFNVLVNGDEVLYEMDETWLDYLEEDGANSYITLNDMAPISTTETDVDLIDVAETLPYNMMHRFEIQENVSIDETCIFGSENNGWCDGASQNDPATLADIELYSKPSVDPGALQLEIFANKTGLVESGQINILLSTDPSFSSIEVDTIVTISFVFNQHNAEPPINTYKFENLQEGVTYYAKINTPGYPNLSISAETGINACVDIDGNPITFIETEDGYRHNLVNLGGKCWFAENLKTGVYNDGTPITLITADDSLTFDEEFIETDSIFAAYIDPREMDPGQYGYISDSEWDAEQSKGRFLGFGYNYLAYDNPLNPNQKNICPEGFRVASVADFEELADFVGQDPGKSLTISEESSSDLFGSYGYNVYYGNNEVQFNGTNNPEWYLFGELITEGYSNPYPTKWTLKRTPNRHEWGAKGAWKDIPGRRNWYFPGTQLSTAPGSTQEFPQYKGPVTAGSEGWPREYLANASLDQYTDGAPDDDIRTWSTGTFPEWTKIFKPVRCVSGEAPPEVRIGGTQRQIPSSLLSGRQLQNAKNVAIVTMCNFDPAANEDSGERLVIDECGSCGGPGILPGNCDCEGNIEDAIGICGGDCAADENNDGICDIAQAAIINDCDAVDYYGYTYQTVLIGDQCWFQDDLRTNTYLDGNRITQITDPGEWSSTTSGAYSFYDNDNQLGMLYNWYAVDNPRGLCPSGWHVPTDNDWKELESSLQMPRSELNSTGYRGLSTLVGEAIGPGGSVEWQGTYGGIRVDNDGSFRQKDNAGYYWTQSSYFSTRARYANSAWSRVIFADEDLSAIGRYRDLWQTSDSKGHGMSVRCLKDSE